jgi:hypothetical protein
LSFDLPDRKARAASDATDVPLSLPYADGVAPGSGGGAREVSLRGDPA